MTKNELTKEINAKRFFLVNYGIVIMLMVALFILLALYFLQIEDKSILEMVIDYYFKNK